MKEKLLHRLGPLGKRKEHHLAWSFPDFFQYPPYRRISYASENRKVNVRGNGIFVTLATRCALM